MRKLYLLAATLTAMIVLTGCGSSEERNHPLFKKGESAQKAGNGAEAAAAYKELLSKREDCVYVHLKLANVYDELLNDPLMAAAHYRTYLEKNPQATDAGEIQALLDRAEKRYYENMKQKYAPADAVPSDADQARIAEMEQSVNVWRFRYEEMRKEVQSLRKNKKSGTASRSSRSTGGADEQGSYTVRDGDTPGKIAQKIYGKSSLGEHIMKANPGVNARKLKPGMKLVIPPKP